MHTEKEADKLWCPADKGQCVGSRCMAWRWTKKPIADEPILGGTNKGSEGIGYCGLAGKPE